MSKLSVITVNRDNLTGLENTLRSVFSQTCRDFECMVVDGGSTDGGAEWLRTIREPNFQWLSEPDEGIYQAMNKGIRLARGQYCLFLNSGDCFCDKSVVAEMLPCLDGTDVVVGRLLRDRKTLCKPMPARLGRMSLAPGIVPHQAAFIRRELFERLGYFREDYQLISDSIFFVEALIRRKIPFNVVAIPVAIYERGGLSETFPELVREEHRRFMRELPCWMRWAWHGKERLRKCLPKTFWQKLKAVAG